MSWCGLHTVTRRRGRNGRKNNGEQRQGSYRSLDLWLPLFYSRKADGRAGRKGEKWNHGIIAWREKEDGAGDKKRSCPLAFNRIEFGADPFRFIGSGEKLDEVLAYLLRIHSFRQFAGQAVSNNVYMDFDLPCREKKFRCARSLVEREEIYLRIQRHKKRMDPDYGGKVCVETARCYFNLPEEEREKYKITYFGRETYAFTMSDRYILGLFVCCEAARQTAAWDGVEYGHLAAQGQKIVRLEGVDGLFQALLLDSVECAGDGFAADLCSAYCLE